ncbi:MAG: LytTR family transcriptional regulator DNA-binding domain-containing protein, partial [Ekhidna sp.]|nr:LytTR family transcriptional regulator DNA-binding domain-containing protein [Ekhidna sp.]
DSIPIEVNDFLQVYATDENVSASIVLEGILGKELTPLEESTNLGMVGNTSHWIYFILQNNSNTKSKYLEVLNPQLDLLSLYQIQDDSLLQLHVTGDQYIFDQRPIRSRNFVLPIEISLGESISYLLHVEKKQSAVDFPIVLYDSEAYYSKLASEGISFGLYFGVLFLVSFFSLAVGVLLKKRVFVVYGVYVFSFAMWFFSKEGFSYQFITSNYPAFNTHFYPMWTSIASMFLIIYIQLFFGTKRLIPKFSLVMSGMVVFFLLGFVVWIIFPQEYLKEAPKLFAIRYLILLLTIVFAYLSAIKSLKVEPIRAKLFLFGYSAFFLGIISELGNEYGFFDLHVFWIPPIMFGYLVEVFALTIAMGLIIVDVIKHRDQLLISNAELKDALKEIEETVDKQASDFITLKSKAVLYHDDIRYIQSDDHYVEYYLVDRDTPEVDRNSISSVRESLPQQFSQIHRSTIVNLRFVKSIYSDKVQLRGGEELRLSRSFKKQMESKLKS